MEIIYKKPEELKPYPNNPRNNQDAVPYVANSIKEFGFKVPIVVDKDGVIVSGHTRWEASKRLNLDKVPVIVADDLTEEQIKAFRIADNKVGELATWGTGKLELELADIDIDMSDFGIEFDTVDDLIGFSDDEEDEGDGRYYGSARERSFVATNFRYHDETRTEGRFEIPMLQPSHTVPKRMIGFNYALSSNDPDAFIHFYLDDYQFERIWSQPYQYVPVMQRYAGCLTPNYSIYLDMPEATKIWNTYRARLLGQIFQDNGIDVIPIVYWSDERSWEYCFDGIPCHSVISVNNIGNAVKEAKELWDAGMRELIKRKQPEKILLYGNGVKEDFDFGNIEVIYFMNNIKERLTNL